MNRFTLRRAAAGTLLAVVALTPTLANAGATLPFGDGESLSVGLSMRSSFSSTSNGSPDGQSKSSNFSADDMRLLLSAKMNDTIGATINVGRFAGDKGVDLIDGFASFDFAPAFHIWAGRFLPPSDRANMNGPYYQLAFDYPGLVSNYYGIRAGRDDGVMAWGKVASDKVVYSIGTFQGRNHSAGVSNTSGNGGGNILFAGRLAVNLLNPEPAPAHLSGNTYYGSAGQILTVAAAGMSQANGVGTNTTYADYKVYNLDFLWELPVAGGSALDVSGAYYKYDYPVAAYAADVTLATSGGGSGNISPPGKAYMLEGGYYFGEKVGLGRFQPFARYQKYDYDAGGTAKRSDFGVNYIIKGSDAKLSAFYIKDDESGTPVPSSNTIKLALQLQF